MTDVFSNSSNAVCGCYGALNGQNGFKLSLFGYEPENDYKMIVRSHDGRRVNLADPESNRSFFWFSHS